MRRPRLVIDTNIFVPGLIGAVAVPPRPSASAGLLRAWRGDRCTLVLSEPLLEEYWRVLRRDLDDNIVLLTAVAGRAELLVTDNMADFQELANSTGKRSPLRYRSVRIVQLSECLTVIRAMHHDADTIMRRRSPW